LRHEDRSADGENAAGLDQTAGRALLGVAGVTSILGIGAADLIRRLGAGRTFVLTALLEGAAIATVGLAPDQVVAVLLAGAAYSTIVTVTVFWGTLIYVDRPSAGVATVAGGNAIGLLAGPLTGGIVADTIGLTAALLGGATIILAAALLKPEGTSFPTSEMSSQVRLRAWRFA